MLRKLLKYDLKESCKLILPILAALLLISLLGRFMMMTELFDSMPDSILIPAVMTYMLLITACFMGVPIYLLVQFYNGLYGNRAYLIHTLPVTTHQKLISKILAAFLMMILSSAACVGAVSLLMLDKETWQYVIQSLPSINVSFKAMTNLSFHAFVCLTIILIMIEFLSYLMSFFAAISLGQLFQKHKIFGAILFYIVINSLNQFLRFFQLMFLAGTDIWDSATAPSASVILALYGLNASIEIIKIGIFYLICYLLMEKKLNLN